MQKRKFLLKINNEIQDNRKYYGYQIKAIIGKIVEESLSTFSKKEKGTELRLNKITKK